MVENSQALIKY